MTAGAADRLLEAQVQFILAEITGERFAEVVARDTADVLRIADTMTVRDVVDPAAVKATGRRLVESIVGSDIVEDMALGVADAVYDMSAGDEYTLGDVVDREPVAALIEQIIGMHTLHDRVLDRFTESPVIATIASTFVNKIVRDFMATSRARAEKVPGVTAVLKAGRGAATKVRGERTFLGDVAGRGAQYALRRTSSAIRDLIHDAPVHDAIMEFWDLHADEPVSGLREYLDKQELRNVVGLVYAIVESSRDKEYIRHAIDAGIDVFFERYGDHSLAALIPELGLREDDIVADIVTFGAPVIEAAERDGVLAAEIRKRLVPFFDSPEVVAILAGG